MKLSKLIKKLMFLFSLGIMVLTLSRPVLAILGNYVEYKVDSTNMYITKIKPSTTVQKFKEKIAKDNITIKNSRGENITSLKSELITTGTKITMDGKEYTAIVYGDIDGDGKYTYKDVLIVDSYINGSSYNSPGSPGSEGPYTEDSTKRPESQKGDGYSHVITLNGKTFKLYKQYSGSYKSKRYRSTASTPGNMSNTGCGPTSCAIALSGLGAPCDPYDVAEQLLEFEDPSTVEHMAVIAQRYNINAIAHKNETPWEIGYEETYQRIKNALTNGHTISIWVGKKANESYWRNFTDSGYHFIALLAIDTSNDKVFVGNPGKSSGWFDLSTVIYAMGTHSTCKGWVEYYN